MLFVNFCSLSSLWMQREDCQKNRNQNRMKSEILRKGCYSNWPICKVDTTKKSSPDDNNLRFSKKHVL